MTRGNQTYLGLDLGASGGRAVAGTLQGGRLHLEEVHRFSNGPILLGKTLYWDFLGLWDNVLKALRLCAARGIRVSCVGIDAWGADFGLLDGEGSLLANPVCYRDARTAGSESILARRISPRRVYDIVGQAPHRVHNLAQLVTMSRSKAGRDLLGLSRCFLPVADLLRYFLCGRRSAELTTAGSCQMLDLRTRRWSRTVIDACGIPRRILPPLVQAGTLTGPLRPELAEIVRSTKTQVAAVAGHDTASAVAALPCVDDDCAFLSCGTWSVVGTISDRPVRASRALDKGFINQVGLDGTFFSRNLMGLHLFETLRRDYAQGGEALTYRQTLEEAAAAKPFAGVLNLNCPLLFYSVGQVLKGTRQFMRISGQRANLTRGQVFRLLLEALAFTYRQTLEDLALLTGRRFLRLGVVGGGTHNGLLCQMTADATGLEVMAGPAEATVMGNLAVQAMACGQVKNAAGVRRLVRDSSDIKRYRPRDASGWDRQYSRYLRVLDQTRNLADK